MTCRPHIQLMPINPLHLRESFLKEIANINTGIFLLKSVTIFSDNQGWIS